MTTITATTILRSRNAADPEKVLSTLLLRYPRFIHAEVMTHRVFSRNAASSRAIPFEKQVAAMLDDPAFPVHWGKNQKGMRADEEIPDDHIVKGLWRQAMVQAVASARILHDQGLHKALVNRIIEPFTHMVCLVSATEWDNFLELRDHPDAEPHIQMLAREVRKCLEDESAIHTLQPGEWHLPFVGHSDMIPAADAAIAKVIADNPDLRDLANASSEPEYQRSLIKLSVARCASTSYKTVDGFDMTLERAIALHDKLVASRPIHASPAEHVAQADDLHDTVVYDDAGNFVGPDVEWGHPEQHGNFVGFRQYRHMLPC